MIQWYRNRYVHVQIIMQSKSASHTNNPVKLFKLNGASAWVLQAGKVILQLSHRAPCTGVPLPVKGCEQKLVSSSTAPALLSLIVLVPQVTHQEYKRTWLCRAIQSTESPFTSDQQQREKIYPVTDSQPSPSAKANTSGIVQLMDFS